jgi:CyaY protein
MDIQKYNQLVRIAFARIEGAFDELDPDVVEADRVANTLQLVFGDGSKIIVSTQSAVHQIWLAGASRGWHFSYGDDSGSWVASKNGDELYQTVERLVSKHLDYEFRIDA